MNLDTFPRMVPLNLLANAVATIAKNSRQGTPKAFSPGEISGLHNRARYGSRSRLWQFRGDRTNAISFQTWANCARYLGRSETAADLLNNRAMTLAEIKKEILKMDPGLAKDENGFAVAVILISSLQAGTSIKGVCQFTGFRWKFVSTVSRRLRANGIWGTHNRVYADWSGKQGAIAFFCDVNVGLGLMQRTP